MKLEFYINGERCNPPERETKKIDLPFCAIEFDYSIVAMHYGIPRGGEIKNIILVPNPGHKHVLTQKELDYSIKNKTFIKIK